MSRSLIPGPVKAECPCGCRTFGGLRKKVWQDGLGPHTKLCPCRRCEGSRTKSRARNRENRIAKDLGGVRSYASGIVSGYDIHTSEVEMEETSNLALVRGLRRWWFSAGVQKKMGRLMSRNLRARAFIATWDGKPQLVVLPYEDFKGLLQIRGIE